MRLRDEQSLFEAIEIFESKFASWIKSKLIQGGYEVDESMSFQELLKTYDTKLKTDRQHVNPLLNWLREKDRCVHLKTRLINGNDHLDTTGFNLLEKTAMDGAVLLLTFQSN